MIETTACRRSRAGLTEYLDDTLPPGKRQGVEHHLAGCRACRTLLAELKTLVEVAATVPPEKMPARAKQALLRALRDGDPG